jgi:Na+/H+ antiporter NhaD/arsenite permease-like protein
MQHLLHANAARGAIHGSLVHGGARPMRSAGPLVIAVVFGIASPVAAATGAPAIDGRALGLIWALPFAGMLLSIAILPLATPKLWHHHYGKIAALWSLVAIAPLAFAAGPGSALYETLHVLVLDYVPFMILLFALFTVAGGILVVGNLHPSPATNTALLAIGTLLAGWMGTTGASMLLILPLIRANDNRRHKIHVFIFFIFLVSNIGGGATPLGDPPLFLGFLLGVDFFWTTTHLFTEMLFCIVVLLALFFAIDSYWYRKEGLLPVDPTPETRAISIKGKMNFVWLAGIIGAVLLSGVWEPGVSVTIYHIEIKLQNVIRDVLMLAMAGLSLWLTPRGLRTANNFSWGPILEVAKLFIGIFLTIIPVLAILRAGTDGSMAPLVALVTDGSGKPINAAYFWLTGGLSSFLDNAPTYLVFFSLAGGNAETLMGPMAATLVAISCGAVFMGANTYIGNAPNFMVKAIVESAGIRMPSFFGYMLWSGAILVPLFVVVTLLFFP